MIEYINFKGETTIVTGALGEIGRRVCKDFAKNGSNLILIDLKEKKEEALLFSKEISDKYSISVDNFTLDISDIESIKKLEEHLVQNNIQIKTLINNVGINILVPAVFVSENQWDNVVDTNLKGTFLMSQIIGRLMIKNNISGSIINISSQHGVVGNVKRAPYCASKAGIINLSKALAIEWAIHNIRVNCVSPTYVKHSKNEEYLEKPLTKKKLLSQIPLGRYCSSEDVSKAVLFLASSMSQMITGHNLVVDGGYTIK